MNSQADFRRPGEPRLQQIALKMPDPHRASFVAFTGREKIELLLRRHDQTLPSSLEEGLWGLDVLADQLEVRSIISQDGPALR